MNTIEQWLASLGLSAYAQSFAENDIDFAVLADLTDANLKEIGVASVGHRVKLLRAIAERGAVAIATQDTVAAVRAQTVAAATSNADHSDEQTRSAAERRHLTVMFCDLVGSTALAARLDPEDMREVVRSYQSACAAVIGRFEGFVAQYLGDGIMAYFGYPAAHEDDAERAVRAGLELIAAVAKLAAQARVEVRIGVATGLVVVGDLIGEGAARERAVTGETPNLAARLQGLAAPGSMVVASSTRRLLGDLFDLRDLGPQQVKGLEAPVPVFAVAGARSFESRFEARAGGLTGFVGREEESECLLARNKLAWQGRGQVVLVSGEAGIGKSRLTAWLVTELTGEPHMRLRYQCTPHHKDSVLYPTIAQIERASGIAPEEAPETKLDKLQAMLALATPDTATTLPLVAALLAIPPGDRFPPLAMTPGQQRQRTLAALLDQVEGLAKRQPLLMIYEDAHWADATSLELIDTLVDRIARLPVLLIVTGRPEFAPAWAGRHNVSMLILQKLGRRDARAMVESVTGGASLPPDVLDQIVAKTDGVPLFVEELTKTVIESGLLVEDGRSFRATRPLPAFAIPATLQDSLMARLDRSNPVKEIAQIGAAIGREFSYKLLVAVAGTGESSIREALAKLEEAELASRRGVPPEATYTFKHALVQDAAYESLLKSRRQVIHRRIAEALRDRFPALAEVEPEIVAHHFTQGQRAEEAFEWWTIAGEHVLRRSACIEAIGHLERAIALADSLPHDDAHRPLRLRLQNAYASALLLSRGQAAPETTAAFSRVTELATQLGDQTARFAGLYGIWVGHFCRGDMLRASDQADAFLREAEEVRSELQISIGHRIVGSTKWSVGNYADAVAHLRQACDLYDFDRDVPLAARLGVDAGSAGLVILAMVLWSLGCVDHSNAAAEKANLQARRTGHVATVAFVHSWNGSLECVRRDPQRTRLHANALVRIGNEHGLNLYASVGKIMLGWVRATSGDRTTGINDIRDGLAFNSARGYVMFDPIFELLLAHAVGLDNPEAGIEILGEKLAKAHRANQLWLTAEFHRSRGNMLSRCKPSDAEATDDAFFAAVAVAQSQGARSFELRASLDLGRHYCATGRKREAGDLLRSALVGFTETPELPEIAEAQRLLASLH